MDIAELEGPNAPAALARLRASSPVAWIAELDAWLVTRYDLALAVMRDATTFTVDDPRFSTARVLGPSMLSLDGAEHRRHRGPFGAPFRAARVHDRYAATIERSARALVDGLATCGRAELRTEFAGPLAVAVMADALGLAGADPTTMLGWYAAIVAAVSALSAGRPVDAAAAVAVSDLADAVRTSLRGDRQPDAEGSGPPTETVLTAALGNLDDAEIVSNAAVMMFGGIETVEGMIAQAIAHRLAHPYASDGVDLAAVVEESLRLEPAAAVVDRYVTRDVELGGTRLGRGDLVRVSLAAANRDPAVFADPDTFHPRRANARLQLAFARGPHACIAMDLARLETTIALRVLLAELPGLRLHAPTRPGGLVFRKPSRVDAIWSPPPARTPAG